MMRKYNPEEKTISQLTVKCVNATTFFDRAHEKKTYEPLQLPDGRIVVVSGFGFVGKPDNLQSFTIFINEKMVARDLEEEDLDRFMSGKNRNRARSEDTSSVSTPKTFLKMYLFTGGTKAERVLEFQKILAQYKDEKIIHHSWPDDKAQQLGAMISNDLQDGPLCVRTLNLAGIHEKAKYNPCDVEIYDLNKAQALQAAPTSSEPSSEKSSSSFSKK